MSTPNVRALLVSLCHLSNDFLGDLVGLKVSHDFEDMDEGDARILTLKDSRILDNEGAHHIFPLQPTILTACTEDELQNVNMAEDERTKKNNELKIKKRDYTGYDDEEFAPGHEGMKRSVLSKYDEDIDGVQETGFRLGSSVQTKAEKVEEQKHAATATVNKALLNIDYASTCIATSFHNRQPKSHRNICDFGLSARRRCRVQETQGPLLFLH
jgi:U4/U6.U5 tri-snRNP-associated protein 1